MLDRDLGARAQAAVPEPLDEPFEAGRVEAQDRHQRRAEVARVARLRLGAGARAVDPGGRVSGAARLGGSGRGRRDPRHRGIIIK
jgi:hypothetical protein